MLLFFGGITIPSQSFHQFSKKGLPTYFRFCNGRNIKNSGWHFSYCGGLDAIIKKRESIVEQQYNNDTNTSMKAMHKAIASGQDIYGRKQFRYAPIKLNSSFPQYLLQNKEKYKDLVIEPSWLSSLGSHLRMMYYARRREVIKFVCIFIPVRSWRKKIRLLYS